jgi:biopolymer transport protein ExbB
MLEFLQTLAKGGVVMIPLGLCSLASLTVLIERFFVLRAAGACDEKLISDLRAKIRLGDLTGALARARQASGPVASVLTSGLEAAMMAGSPNDAMTEEALMQLPYLQRRLAVLDTVVTIAPLLGLLGTVVGMISSFHILAGSGTEHPAGITGGIAEALIATATGLVIAIFSLVGFNWCQERIRNIGAEMEKCAAQLANILALAKPKNALGDPIVERRDEALV